MVRVRAEGLCVYTTHIRPRGRLCERVSMQAKSKTDTKIQVLLKEVVEGVGKKNEVVKVNSGYYNNFLRPKNLASIISDEGVQEKVAKEKVRKLHRPSAYTSRSTDFFSRMFELMYVVCKIQTQRTGGCRKDQTGRNRNGNLHFESGPLFLQK